MGGQRHFIACEKREILTVNGMDEDCKGWRQKGETENEDENK